MPIFSSFLILVFVEVASNFKFSTSNFLQILIILGSKNSVKYSISLMKFVFKYYFIFENLVIKEINLKNYIFYTEENCIFSKNLPLYISVKHLSFSYK